MKNSGQTEEDNRDSGVLSIPLSFVRSSNYDWSSAGLYGRGGFGGYWTLNSIIVAYSYYLSFYSTGLLQNHNLHGYGFAVRCVAE